MIIFLGSKLLYCSSDATRKVSGQPQPFPIRSCFGWGLPSQPVSRLLVRSYRTFPPLPLAWRFPFLWHFPWGHPRRTLSGILPCEARTFLTPYGPQSSFLLACYSIAWRRNFFKRKIKSGSESRGGTPLWLTTNPFFYISPKISSALLSSMTSISQPCSAAYVRRRFAKAGTMTRSV